MTIFGKIVLGGLLLVVAGGALYGVTSFVSNDVPKQEEVVIVTTTPQVVVATTTASSTLQKPTGKKIAFTELMKQGGSYKCTVTQNVANMASNGIVYIHNNLIKANFSTSIQGQTIDSNMISRDGYTYTWTTMMKGVGYKVKIVEKSDQTPKGAASTTYTWNGEQIGEYDCQALTADDSIFELPKDIVFSSPK